MGPGMRASGALECVCVWGGGDGEVREGRRGGGVANAAREVQAESMLALRAEVFFSQISICTCMCACVYEQTYVYLSKIKQFVYS